VGLVAFRFIELSPDSGFMNKPASVMITVAAGYRWNAGGQQASSSLAGGRFVGMSFHVQVAIRAKPRQIVRGRGPEVVSPCSAIPKKTHMLHALHVPY
jgi:hypothetical protein